MGIDRASYRLAVYFNPIFPRGPDEGIRNHIAGHNKDWPPSRVRCGNLHGHALLAIFLALNFVGVLQNEN